MNLLTLATRGDLGSLGTERCHFGVGGARLQRARRLRRKACAGVTTSRHRMFSS